MCQDEGQETAHGLNAIDGSDGGVGKANPIGFNMRIMAHHTIIQSLASSYGWSCIPHPTSR